MPFADVLRTRIFEPLGMRDTAFWTPDTGRLATAYVPTDDGLQLWDRAGRPLEQATDILRWSGRRLSRRPWLGFLPVGGQ
jgi:CubicO group peptidase (beta-lactamase class C family)